MTNSLNIAVLAGGTSSERAVSLRSGAAVQQALQQAGHQVTMLDPAEPISDQTFAEYDVIFPVLHGARGEDGVLQARLEALSLHNYVGSDATSSQLCFDKWGYKQLLIDNQISTPQGAIASSADLQINPLVVAPFVLKPYNGGSSVDTYIVRDVSKADFDLLEAACERHETMLLEELIEGTEITVGVLGDEALPVIEIIPPSDGEFDYENKYNGATQELCPPQNVSQALQDEAMALAAQIHDLCGCRDMSRTDMMISADGKLYVLETNTIPGMTDQSLLPKAAATAGISMVELCSRLVTAAADRR